MKKVRHWLHILIAIVTGGIWLFPYVVIIATTEMFNRGYKIGKAAGRVQRQNEIDEERAQPKTIWKGALDPRTMNCRSVGEPIVGADGEIHGYR